MNGDLPGTQGGVVFKEVTKTYPDGTNAVDRLDLEIRSGGLVSLIGPSGCGKTTTLKMINRLEDPTSGRITVEGEDILRCDPVELRRRIGYVVQEIALFPHMTVSENIAVVPSLLGWPAKKIRSRVDELLAMAGFRRKNTGSVFPISSAEDRSSGSACSGPWRRTRRSSSWTNPSAPWIP